MEKLRTINPEQLASILRTVLQVVGGIVAANGWIADEQWVAISGGLLTIATTAWGLWARKDSNLIKSAADVPAVEKIVAPGTSAVADPDYPKVKSA